MRQLMEARNVLIAGLGLVIAAPAFAGQTLVTDEGLASPTGLRRYTLTADSQSTDNPTVFELEASADAVQLRQTTGTQTIFGGELTGSYWTGAEQRINWDSHLLFGSSEVLQAPPIPAVSEDMAAVTPPAGLDVGSGVFGSGAASIDDVAVTTATGPVLDFYQLVVAPGDSVNVTGRFIADDTETPFNLTLEGFIPGDADADDDVDLDDLTILGTFFGGTGSWSKGDFDGDTDIDLDDLTILGTFFGSASPSSLTFEQALAEAGFATTPEPTTLALLSLGALALTTRRRR